MDTITCGTDETNNEDKKSRRRVNNSNSMQEEDMKSIIKMNINTI